MSDEEKVLSDLKDIVEYFMRLYREEEDHHIYDQYYDRMVVVSNACNLIEELLKEQEPRVLTIEELKTIGDKDAVYLETIVMNLGEPNVKPAIYQPDNSDDEYVCVVSSWLKSGFYSPHNYLKSWRCWSARPTDEQREAVPWES